MGLFRVFDIEYLRPTLSAGGSVARVGRSAIPPYHPLTLLVQALQFLSFLQLDKSRHPSNHRTKKPQHG